MVYCGISGVVNASTNTTCTTNNAYVNSDFQNIVVDGLGTGGASFVSWVDLIVLLVVLGVIVGIFMKLANLFR